MITPCRFFRENKVLCIATLGIGFLVGYYGPRLIRWIKIKFGTAKKTDQVAKTLLSIPVPQPKGKGKSASPPSDRSPAQKNAAVVVFQKIFRGHQARKALGKSGFNSHALWQKVKYYIKNEHLLAALPAANNGLTKVYFPKDLPSIVIKESYQKSAKRLEKIEQARKICGDSNYTHLKIPKARICQVPGKKDRLIEERLPIPPQFALGKQVGFYCENQKQMTKAIQEFTELCCKATYGDLIQKDKKNDTKDTPRYDNIPLFKDAKGKYKIGLIDLEEFSTKKPSNIVDVMKLMVSLFPKHSDQIIEIGQKHSKDVAKKLSEIEKARVSAEQLLKDVYEDHTVFLNKRGISINNPDSFSLSLATLKKTRVESLKKVVGEFLIKLHTEGDPSRSVNCKGMLGTNPNDTIKRFHNEAFDRFFNILIDNLKSTLQLSIKEHSTIGPVLSVPDLVYCRTLKLKIELFHGKLGALLQMFTLPTKKGILIDANGILAALIVETLLNELVKGGELLSAFPTRDKICLYPIYVKL